MYDLIPGETAVESGVGILRVDSMLSTDIGVVQVEYPTGFPQLLSTQLTLRSRFPVWQPAPGVGGIFNSVAKPPVEGLPCQWGTILESDRSIHGVSVHSRPYKIESFHWINTCNRLGVVPSDPPGFQTLYTRRAVVYNRCGKGSRFLLKADKVLELVSVGRGSSGSMDSTGKDRVQHRHSPRLPMT